MPTPEYTDDNKKYFSERFSYIYDRWTNPGITKEELDALKEELEAIIFEYFRPCANRIEAIQKQEIINKIKQNPENYFSKPWNPLEGFLDTLYLSRCYISEFFDFLLKNIEEVLKKNDSKSKEVIDTESYFHPKFSFGSIFSKENIETQEVPYTGEYQCSLKKK